MYGQMNVTFDEIYGWEATLLEPSAFWREVPPALRAKYHFYDTYMEANVTNGNSPLRMIKQIARQNDFVAFKLDIDTPKVEIPTALEILNNPELTTLIDEFYLELHFRCDIMIYCGWGDDIPTKEDGLIRSRWHAMNFFRECRMKGIRSHFWP